MTLEVWDSPNSAGGVIDAIRCCKLALDRGVGGALVGPASYFMKTPPQQFTDEQAQLATEKFIAGEPPQEAAPLPSSPHRLNGKHLNGKANGHARPPLVAAKAGKAGRGR